MMSAIGGELRAKGVYRDKVEHVLPDFLLQFVARWSFECWNSRIGGTRDESALGLRLDLIGKARDEVLEVHGEMVARAKQSRMITFVTYLRLFVLRCWSWQELALPRI